MFTKHSYSFPSKHQDYDLDLLIVGSVFENFIWDFKIKDTWFFFLLYAQHGLFSDVQELWVACAFCCSSHKSPFQTCTLWPGVGVGCIVFVLAVTWKWTSWTSTSWCQLNKAMTGFISFRHVFMGPKFGPCWLQVKCILLNSGNYPLDILTGHLSSTEFTLKNDPIKF